MKPLKKSEYDTSYGINKCKVVAFIRTLASVIELFKYFLKSPAYGNFEREIP